MGIMIKNQVLQITNKQKLMLPKVKVVMTIITKEILMEIKDQVVYLKIINKETPNFLPKVRVDKVVMGVTIKEVMREIKSQVVHPKITNKARVVKVVMEVTVKEVFREIQVDYLKTTKVVKVSIPG